MMQTEFVKRLGLTVAGRVQGVGFRPFVWRQAVSCGVSGFVQNTSAGVRIEIQGRDNQLDEFLAALKNRLPPLARIYEISTEELPVLPSERDFSIAASHGHAGQNILVSPDAGVCRECLEDVRDPQNRRYGYAFANCTNCGPRFSITRNLPYDRPMTCMSCFDLCPDCAAEYSNPADRRFHAQPIACARCGPKLWLVDRTALAAGRTLPDSDNTRDVLERSARLLLAGGIIALKGLGGFQLACDARNDAAVARLRERKKRPAKALAVMTGNVEAAEEFCLVTSAQAELLESVARPIVLCPKKKDSPSPLSDLVAPDTATIGVLLANTPLHALLFDKIAEIDGKTPVLVMTSANITDEPICLGNREALEKLPQIADAWLMHDRDILVRVDDSVVSTASSLFSTAADKAEEPVFIRRARGYVPMPVELFPCANAPSVFGAGAELKTTFCLTRGNQAFTGQHIGDLKSPATLEFYSSAYEHLRNLLETKPAACVHDLHPDFISTRFAQDLAAKNDIPLIALQHHAAHAASCLAENSYIKPALALCLDGSGLGTDGTIWGGELIYMDLGQAVWHRAGSLSHFALPGGDAAIREPWRAAYSLMRAASEKIPVAAPSAAAVKIVSEMLDKNINCIQTSSCGRLFDGLAAMLGLCTCASYEGQAPLLLEKQAQAWLDANPDQEPPPLWEPVLKDVDNLPVLDGISLFANAVRAVRQGRDVATVAAAFHFAIARGFALLAARAAARENITAVALSGGVLQNRIIAALLKKFLREHGLEPLTHRQLPPGDGGLSFGQAAWGRQLLINDRK